MDLVNNVRKYIEQNKLQEAINAFVEWATANEQAGIRQQLSLHQQKFATVKKHENIGIMTYSDAMRERTAIGYALLELLQEVESIVIEQKPRDEPDERYLNDKKCILFLASNPSSTAQLQLYKEFADISQKLQDNQQQYSLVSEWATTADTLHSAILKYKPTIIHFSGHGTSSLSSNTADNNNRALALRDTSSQSGIILEDGKGGSQIVSGELLKEMFSVFANLFKIEVIVLNACYSEEQARLIAPCVEYVVGMSDSVLDTAAIDFSGKFYRNMAANLKAEDAFRLTKTNVGMNAFDNKILTLYKDGTRLY